MYIWNGVDYASINKGRVLRSLNRFILTSCTVYTFFRIIENIEFIFFLKNVIRNIIYLITFSWMEGNETYTANKNHVVAC